MSYSTLFAASGGVLATLGYAGAAAAVFMADAMMATSEEGVRRFWWAAPLHQAGLLLVLAGIWMLLVAWPLRSRRSVLLRWAGATGVTGVGLFGLGMAALFV
jgi:NADH:ubiquinone oxidoreductase subunit 6 (subunit J)